jgi:hypothetical protein
VPAGGGGLKEPFARFVAISTLNVINVSAWAVTIPAAPNKRPDRRTYFIFFI